METAATPAVSARTMILPLALAQFLCTYAATIMNVAVSDIARDLGITVIGVQTAITLFTLGADDASDLHPDHRSIH
jgi:hypothetical protein